MISRAILKKLNNSFITATILVVMLFASCAEPRKEEIYDYNIDLGNDLARGVMMVNKESDTPAITLRSFEWGTMVVGDIHTEDDQITGSFKHWDIDFEFSGTFKGNNFEGNLFYNKKDHPFKAIKQSEIAVTIDRSKLKYMLDESNLAEYEQHIDHAGMIAAQDQAAYDRGYRIYQANCINCHGNTESEGSIPLSTKFWSQNLKGGSDTYSMYQTVTRGLGSMPPQVTLTPQEKHDVILYIREAFIRKNENETFINNSVGYLASLPKGDTKGPDAKPYQPWADMNYGNFFINTYELVDEETGPERYHSPGPSPFPDEDYSKNNFAYKGIAIRLDKGEGGIAKGKAWMMFDHDLMRVAGGWTGNGFIDWQGILLNDQHETYPRTIGKLHFETPVAPAWANPITGSFEDPRFTARDGRQFGPLPKNWANYKGLYHHDDHIILSYTVGSSDILEEMGMIDQNEKTIFTRTLNISPSKSILKLKVAPSTARVAIKGIGASLSEEDGYYVLNINKSAPTALTIFIADAAVDNINEIANQADDPISLLPFTKEGGSAHYPQRISSTVTRGKDDGLFAVDELTPPFKNPWDCRMKLSGIDFLKDPNIAVACATDGDVWKITGMTADQGELEWQRIASGLFQPLGIKVINEEIFVTCRDQLVRLRDFNGDGETDYYESFNHDHQVTDHFHEFAMGLQADRQGNLYYAKSGRHAREALIPQHGTLIKVSKDGSKSEIVATGFRAANGVCINPDGSFIVTDQQGYWNPMNRINWVEPSKQPKFYGNMWGYNPPADSSRAAMEQPLVWVDMDFDRSPSELLWVESEKWGPLNGSLLSFSYGYGKIQLVLREKVSGQQQGGVIDLPGVKFLTGVMRGRFNPSDGHLYACGMSAWGTNQMIYGGGLYRVRYTDKALPLPTQLNALEGALKLTFTEKIDAVSGSDLANYKIETWDLIRSKKYGSDRHNRQQLQITSASISNDQYTVLLEIPNIKPTDVMTVDYNIKDQSGNVMKGTVQNTIHRLGKGPLF